MVEDSSVVEVDLPSRLIGSGSSGSPVPHTCSPVPHSGSPVPHTGSPVPHTGSPVPHSGSPSGSRSRFTG
ncbi:hypothetical protein EYF80_041860 [Liparis tanakae]|uniref:Uncharacterized protein n=1 Tax=Liparis tanakae TaxID=230148 RepID=A0A4Z2G300_9TELE|nr:hypothetical protein EYF80_041860 [Liparis tanakae]